MSMSIVDETNALECFTPCDFNVLFDKIEIEAAAHQAKCIRKRFEHLSQGCFSNDWTRINDTKPSFILRKKNWKDKRPNWMCLSDSDNDTIHPINLKHLVTNGFCVWQVSYICYQYVNSREPKQKHFISWNIDSETFERDAYIPYLSHPSRQNASFKELIP